MAGILRGSRHGSSLVRLVTSTSPAAGSNQAAGASVLPVRLLGGGGVPEYWGRPSDYTPGTDFLGTPKDHLDRVKKRPVSPHVFEVDGAGMHYKMPINAISSITNRATGVALTAAITGAGAIALTGDLPAVIASFKAAYPLLVVPLKAAISFPLIYHYAAGVRHVIWDHHTIGKQAEHNSYLENEAVDKSSRALFAVSAVGTLALSLYSF